MENTQPHENGRRLLVVDDEPIFAFCLREKFTERGYSVATAGDASEALALVATSTAPTVVVLDLVLPKVSGQQLLRELARGPRASEIRVVLLSAHHAVETVEPNHPMVVARAQKPVDLGELARMVDVASRDLVAQSKEF
jgi:CheY-like chemotaxis protein